MANNVIGSTHRQGDKMAEIAGGISGIKGSKEKSSGKTSGDGGGDKPGGGSSTRDRLEQGNRSQKNPT